MECSGLLQVLAVLPGFNPSTLMDVVKPMLALERSGVLRVRVALEAYVTPTALTGIDLVIFCRNLEPRYAGFLEAVLQRGIPYIYDLDDNLFDVPPETWDGRYYCDPQRSAQLERYLRFARKVRVYSPALEQRVAGYNQHVELVTPPLDWTILPKPRSRDEYPAQPGGEDDIQRTRRDPVRIVYATSRRDDHLFQIFAPALDETLRRFAGRVEITFWGFLPPAFVGRPGVHYRRFNPNYNHFLRQFAAGRFEIGLAPMLDDVFHRSKTNNKFREYGACGIAGVYSDVALYHGSVIDGETGLLAENDPAAWTEAISQLIKDPGLRQRLGIAAQQYVYSHYDPEKFLRVWQHHLEEALPSRPIEIEMSPVAPEPRVDLPDESSEVVSGVGPDQANKALASSSASSSGWGYRLRRGFELVSGGELGRALFNARVHLANLWWLFKINRLKRL